MSLIHGIPAGRPASAVRPGGVSQIVAAENGGPPAESREPRAREENYKHDRQRGDERLESARATRIHFDCVCVWAVRDLTRAV